MKRWFRSLLFLALAVSVLTVTVFADMGPKPQLTVKVVNPPEEPYTWIFWLRGITRITPIPLTVWNGVTLTRKLLLWIRTC